MKYNDYFISFFYKYMYNKLFFNFKDKNSRLFYLNELHIFLQKNFNLNLLLLKN